MTDSMSETIIRSARSEDLDRAAELVLRLKRLNGEFDPMFAVVEDALQAARKYLDEALKNESSIVLVAEVDRKVSGILKADVRDRRFYNPRFEGAVEEIYVLPEYRRLRVGEQLINEAAKKLKEKGAEVLTARFPSANMMAVNFYTKLGFRSLVSVYATKFSK